MSSKLSKLLKTLELAHTIMAELPEEDVKHLGGIKSVKALAIADTVSLLVDKLDQHKQTADFLDDGAEEILPLKSGSSGVPKPSSSKKKKRK